MANQTAGAALRCPGCGAENPGGWTFVRYERVEYAVLAVEGDEVQAASQGNEQSWDVNDEYLRCDTCCARIPLGDYSIAFV
jgi:hypothetical protein